MMKYKIAAVLAISAFIVPGRTFADSNASASSSSPTWDSVKIWFQHWKDGLASSAVEGEYQQRSLTAVAAVRGDEQKLDDPNKPYIKGTLSEKQTKMLKKERVELGQAVDLILAGKINEGSKKLDEFEAKHPKSLLLGDVQKAREKLKALNTAPAKS